jgi:hypothetical protein
MPKATAQIWNKDESQNPEKVIERKKVVADT